MAAHPYNRWSASVTLVVFLCVTGTLTAFIAAQIARIDLGGGYRLTAVFDDVTGLNPGDQVKIAGAPVGRVDAIEVRDGRAEVRMTVGDAHRLPADSEAAVRWRSPIGQRVVYLIPGTARARLRDGGTITRTRSVVDIGELITRLAPLTRSLDPKRLNEIVTSVYQALEGNDGDVTRLVANVDELTSTIAARRQTLTRTLRDFATVSAILARRDGQIARMTDDLVTLSEAFVDNRRLVDDALTRLAAMMRTTDQVAGRNADELAQVVERLSFVMGGTRRNLDGVQEAVRVAGPKMRRLFDMLNEGEFTAGASPCLTLSPGPCPYRTRLTDYPDRGTSAESLRRMLLGGG